MVKTSIKLRITVSMRCRGLLFFIVVLMDLPPFQYGWALFLILIIEQKNERRMKKQLKLAEFFTKKPARLAPV
jgi:hypothetical protein